MAAASEPTWVDGPTAVAILDVPDVRNVDRLVGEGLVGVRRLPGVRARYRRDDLIGLARLALAPRVRGVDPQL